MKATDLIDEPPRGRITLGFQTVATRGNVTETGRVILPDARTDTQSMTLTIDYRLDDRWSVYASLPYITKRARSDIGAHNPARLVEPHPESEFLDDGAYHGDWQDLQIGLVRHGRLAGFDIASHAVLNYPTHDYTFFASAAVGQDLRSLRLGADASRRLGHTNFEYSFGYSYELVEKVLGINLNKHHVRLEANYHITPQLSAFVYANGRWSQGRDGSFFFPERARGSELWYQHDRLLRQNHAIAGAGASWQFNGDWAISLGGGRMIWARSLQKMKYAYDVQLSRSF